MLKWKKELCNDEEFLFKFFYYNMAALNANTVLDAFPEMILINPYNQELYKAVMPITSADDWEIDDLLEYLDNQYDIKLRTFICAGKEIIINDSHKARQLKTLLGELEDTYQKYKINPEKYEMKLNAMLENAEIPDEILNVYRADLNNIIKKNRKEKKSRKNRKKKTKMEQ